METIILTEFLSNSQYGWLLVLIAAGVISTRVILSGLESIVVSLAKLKIAVGINSQDYKKQLKNESDVTAVLKAVREEFAADRVVLMQYHNGVKSVANNHLLKVSASHEVMSSTARSMLTNIQQWPSNFIDSWNPAVFDNDYITVGDNYFIKDNSEAKGVYEFLYRYGVKRLVVFPVSDPYGAVFGLAMVHLSGDHVIPSPQRLKWAYARFQAIGALLSGVTKD